MWVMRTLMVTYSKLHRSICDNQQSDSRSAPSGSHDMGILKQLLHGVLNVVTLQHKSQEGFMMRRHAKPGNLDQTLDNILVISQNIHNILTVLTIVCHLGHL